MDDLARERTKGSLRAGDAERDDCAAQLLQHYLAGRLDHAEYERRQAVATAATWDGELTDLLVDLPWAPGDRLLVTSEPRKTGRRGLQRRCIAQRGAFGVRRLWPLGVLWGGAFVAQGGSTADWWHLNPDISTGFIMASFGYATHWIVTKVSPTNRGPGERG